MIEVPEAGESVVAEHAAVDEELDRPRPVAKHPEEQLAHRAHVVEASRHDHGLAGLAPRVEPTVATVELCGRRRPPEAEGIALSGKPGLVLGEAAGGEGMVPQPGGVIERLVGSWRRSGLGHSWSVFRS